MKQWLLKMLIKYLLSYTPKEAKDMIGKIAAWLSGKKAYIGAIALTLQAIVEYLGDSNLNTLITKLIAAWTIVSVRSAIK